MVTPIAPNLCGVFSGACARWRWARDTWRFLYRNRLEARHWPCWSRTACCWKMAPNANERENLYQHDMGVVRLRRVMRSAAQEQIEAEKARA
jgi:hypothetical protein